MNYYVSADGPLLGDGSQDAPFRRIGQAAEAARPGGHCGAGHIPGVCES